MPTPLDNVMKSKNMLLAFGGAIVATGVWSIWGGDLFPAEPDPTGDPQGWTEEELRRWLRTRNLFPSETASKEDLVARVLANMRAPRTD